MYPSSQNLWECNSFFSIQPIEYSLTLSGAESKGINQWIPASAIKTLSFKNTRKAKASIHRNTICSSPSVLQMLLPKAPSGFKQKERQVNNAMMRKLKGFLSTKIKTNTLLLLLLLLLLLHVWLKIVGLCFIMGSGGLT